ncbi:MAG: SGNH/GDSL hydrolase family protein [Firmicutes bacterium]|nr:SGNH/GDSL hydrolase family protein [Bacillota bacterium]
MKTSKAAIFGDSIMRGAYWHEESQGYKIWNNTRYIQNLAEHLGVDVVNYSQMGATVERGETKIDNALAAGLDCQTAFLEYGGNDSDFDWAAVAADPRGSHQPRTALPRFRQSYLRIIETLRGRGIQPVLMSLPPIDSRRYFQWFSQGLDGEALRSWLEDLDSIYRHQEAYSLEVERIAAAAGCPLVDLRLPLLLRRDLPRLLCTDGIHPSPEGYHVIWQEIEKFCYDFWQA